MAGCKSSHSSGTYDDRFSVINALAEYLVKDSIPSFAKVENLLFLSVNMKTWVGRLSWFDGLDTLQTPGNCSHVRKAESRRLLTNLVYTVQGVWRNQQKYREKGYCTHLGILEGFVSTRKGRLDR